MKVYNVQLKCLKCPLMRITHRLQILNSLLKHITPAFQSLDLIFESFDLGHIIVYAFGTQRISSVKYRTGTLANILGSASQSL